MSDDEPMASDKLAVLSRAIEYLQHESDVQRLSIQEILDIDQLYNVIEGRKYEG